MKRFLRPRWFVWGLLPILLWWAWKEVSLTQVVQLLSGLSIWQILMLLCLNGCLTLLFSLRWWLILIALGFKMPYLKLAGYRLAGFAISFLTPGPQFGGEPVQVYALTSKEHIPGPVALASVVLDKTLELLASFTFLAFGVLVVLTSGLMPDHRLTQVGLALGSLVALPGVYLGLLLFGKRPLSAGLELAARRVPFAAGQVRKIARAIEPAEEQALDFCRGQPGVFSLVLVVSMLVWGLVILEYWLSFRFLGLALSFVQVVFALVAGRAALLLPVPGGFGTLEVSQVLVLRALGHDPAFAVGVMLLARVRDLLLAGLGIWRGIALTRYKSIQSLPVQAGESFHSPSGG